MQRLRLPLTSINYSAVSKTRNQVAPILKPSSGHRKLDASILISYAVVSCFDGPECRKSSAMLGTQLLLNKEELTAERERLFSIVNIAITDRCRRPGIEAVRIIEATECLNSCCGKMLSFGLTQRQGCKE